MLTNTIIILNGHFHDVLGHPVPPWNLLEIAVVVFFLGWMPILFTSRQSQNNENKKLSYHRDSVGWRSLRCLGLFKVTDFCTNQLRSQRPNKADDRAGSKTLFLLHSQTYKTYNLKFYVIFFYNFRQFAALSKCRLVWPAPPALPRYASVWMINHSLSLNLIVHSSVLSIQFALLVMT